VKTNVGKITYLNKRAVMNLYQKLKRYFVKQRRFSTTVDLPETSIWTGTVFQHELNLAITNGFAEVSTPDGYAYKIINDGKVKGITI